MKTIKQHLLSTCITFGLAALSLTSSAASKAADDGQPLYIYGTIDALLAGAYDGNLTIRDLASKGTIGLGTFNRLNGEMVMLDGLTFHVKADGTVSVADPAERTPLAYVMPFVPGDIFLIDTGASTSVAEIERLVDARLPNKNLFYSAKLAGEFTAVSTRAIAPQVRPYRALAEVSKEQVVFRRGQVAGSLVGIRSPAFSKGISVPGWHWHFLSDDHEFGGHVLGASLTKGVLKVATARNVDLHLPDTEDFGRADQTRDRTVELHRVESDRSEPK